MALDHPAPLRVQVRARAFSWPEAPQQHVVIAVNGRAYPQVPLAAAWDVAEVVTAATDWRSGVNLVTLTFGYARRPAEIGGSPDQREIAAAVDYVRIAVVP
jgi:hypothetical protein